MLLTAVINCTTCMHHSTAHHSPQTPVWLLRHLLHDPVRCEQNCKEHVTAPEQTMMPWGAPSIPQNTTAHTAGGVANGPPHAAVNKHQVPLSMRDDEPPGKGQRGARGLKAPALWTAKAVQRQQGHAVLFTQAHTRTQGRTWTRQGGLDNILQCTHGTGTRVAVTALCAATAGRALVAGHQPQGRAASCSGVAAAMAQSLATYAPVLFVVHTRRHCVARVLHKHVPGWQGTCGCSSNTNTTSC
jgi:hypothetical protein